MKTWERVLATAVVVTAGFASGWATGKTLETRSQEAASSFLSHRDQRILAVVVKRNPQATIREFSEFAGKLTSGAHDLNLDFRYVMAIIDRESEWKPQAVSPAGAIGLMQVMPDTASFVVKKMQWEGYEAPVHSRGPSRYSSLGSLGDALWNIKIGMQYLRWQIDEYGLGPEHLRAYNRGGTKALAYWPRDRYAEDIGFRLITLVHEVR